jgi:2-methylcitrate dehydratase PrpD
VRPGSDAGAAAQALAHAAAGTVADRLPATVRERAIDLVLDAVAVMATGSADGGWRSLVVRLRGPMGTATLIGDPSPVAPSPAALLNGAAMTIEQLSDGHRRARGHPAAHVVPAALAVAETEGASGEAFLSAIVAGYEVAARVGIALGGTRRGIHDVGTWGMVGAAAAVAHLLTRGEEAAILRAIEGSAGLTLRPPTSTLAAGAPVHHLAAGLSVQAALVCGEAAAAGFEAVPGSLETFLGPGLGAGFDPALLVEGIEGGAWHRFEILEGYIKIHPTTAHAHGANDALEDLLAAGSLDAGEIDDILVRTYAGAARLSAARPANGFAARFSIPWTVAAAIVTGGLGADAFSAERLADPVTRALARRVRVRRDPACDAGYPAGRPTIVEIRLRDGRTLRAASTAPRGDAANPVPRSVIHAKAHRLLAGRFGEAAADAVLAVTLAIEDGRALPSDLGRELRAAASG